MFCHVLLNLTQQINICEQDLVMNFNDLHSFIVQANYLLGALFNMFIAVLLQSFAMKQHKILIQRGNLMGSLKVARAEVFEGCPMDLIIP